MDFNTFPFGVNALFVVLAIALVGTGAHWVVDGASGLARRLRISELVIGLTVVGFGTSAPEFAVTLTAAFRGYGDISVGNVVGSNIFNLGFILGGCALVRAIPTHPTLLWRDGFVLGSTTLLLLAFVAYDLHLGHADGAVLFTLLILYLAYVYRSRHAHVDAEEDAEAAAERPGSQGSVVADVGMLLLGLAGILAGSHLLVEAAAAMARTFGISEWVIGVTIVAAGTSMPEFATSVVAVWRGRYGLSVGNVIGSDIFNLLGVLGVAGLLRPVQIDPMARVSLAALSGMVFVVLIFIRSGWRISRLEGATLIAIALVRWGFDLTSHLP